MLRIFLQPILANFRVPIQKFKKSKKSKNQKSGVLGTCLLLCCDAVNAGKKISHFFREVLR